MRKQKLTPDQVRVSQEQKLRAQTVPNKKRYKRPTSSVRLAVKTLDFQSGHRGFESPTEC